MLVPQGKIALGKLAQAVAHGARILQIDGNFDDCLELARKTAADYPVAALVNSVNPTRIAGQASAAYEICDELGRAPDVHCLPVGNAGNITAYWAGYRAYLRDGLITDGAADVRLPGRGRGAAGARRAGPQPGDDRDRDPDRGTRRRGRPRSPRATSPAGRFAAVTDDEILAAYRLLSAREAVFVEPASAASVAGLLQSAADGTLPRGSLVVCTVTGHGLKDPDTALLAAPAPTVVPIDPGAVADALELALRTGAMGTISEVRVRVPGSSANLGPGFDSLGLALGLYDDVEVAVASRRRRRSRCYGEGAGQVPCDEAHLVVRAMRRRLGVARRRPARDPAALPQRHPALARAGQLGGRRGGRCGRGRGAGRPRPGAGAGDVAAGHRRVWRGTPTTRRRACSAASWWPGRPDGAGSGAVPRCTARRAPGHPPGGARRGGRVVDQHHPWAAARPGPAGRRRVHRQPHRARGAGVHPRPDLLLPATEDRLHQDYRRPAYPESADLVDALRARGVPAAISGAGPTVLALTTDGALPAGVDLHGFTVLPLPVDTDGRCRSSWARPGSGGRDAGERGGCCRGPAGTSTLGSATAIHASSAWPLEPDCIANHLSLADLVPTRAACPATVATIAAPAGRAGVLDHRDPLTDSRPATVRASV